jgi:hypothetical protein
MDQEFWVRSFLCAAGSLEEMPSRPPLRSEDYIESAGIHFMFGGHALIGNPRSRHQRITGNHVILAQEARVPFPVAFEFLARNSLHGALSKKCLCHSSLLRIPSIVERPC